MSYQNYSKEKTVAAVSSALGAGGIAVIRMSGPAAHAIGKEVFRPARPEKVFADRRMYLGWVVDPDSARTLDQALCVFMEAPGTYTGEDVVEIHCHGGPVAAGAVLECLINRGAELAAAGEFTRRAFMAGKIDLSQAEAVAELIGARSRAEADLALAQLSGGLKRKVEEFRAVLVGTLADVEVALDYPDEEEDIVRGGEAAEEIRKKVSGPLSELLKDYESGRVMREGLSIAIVGRPNVGKSSLMNALLKKERSIVTEIPGTTRDLIEADAIINGIPVIMVDTAGLEAPTEDPVEREGQRRAAERLAGADLALVVVDSGRELTEEDLRIAEAAPKGRILVVVNKVDAARVLTAEHVDKLSEYGKIARISAKRGDGLAELKDSIFRMVTGGVGEGGSLPELVPNLRHKKALESALEPLERAAEGLEVGLAPELVAFEINAALAALGQIVGATTPDDVLDEIFSRFCLGK